MHNSPRRSKMEPTRYDPEVKYDSWRDVNYVWMKKDRAGDWVSYDDYLYLEIELEHYKQQLAKEKS